MASDDSHYMKHLREYYDKNTIKKVLNDKKVLGIQSYPHYVNAFIKNHKKEFNGDIQRSVEEAVLYIENGWIDMAFNDIFSGFEGLSEEKEEDDSSPAAKPEPEPAAKPEPEPAAKPEPEPEPVAKAAVGPKPAAKPEPVADTKEETEEEPKEEPKSAAEEQKDNFNKKLTGVFNSNHSVKHFFTDFLFQQSQ